jgi:FtsP/CotA-like multicopper oxidase with cupredoxin domain
MFTRRRLCEAAALLAGAGAVSGRAQAAAIPEAPTTRTNAMQPPLVPASGPHYQPVVTLNGWTLPWRMNGDWKEFHLVAEPVEREFAPGMTVHLWGYNGQSPGPTIECIEGDKVRIFVTNKLPEQPACIGTACWFRAAWTASAASPSRISSPARPSSTSSSSRQAAPSCTIRTPTKWCRWAWA